jgi:hypothetical protein
MALRREGVTVLVRLLLIATLSLPCIAAAQLGTATGGIQGRLAETVTHRPVLGAEVQLLQGAAVRRATRSDASGGYVFADVPEGVYQVAVQHEDYLKALQPEVRVVLRRISAVDFALVRAKEREQLTEVFVTARASREDPLSTPNTVHLEREEIRRIPGSGGDVFRALDVLPGVVATGEFSNFTVRGNGPRDNLIIVDGIPFDKVVHFDESFGEQEELDGGGRYSIFAPNVVGNARFSPGGWRASEGGKTGSLLELDVAEANAFSSTIGARVDIVGAELDYEGPSYVADNTSVLLSVRSFDFSNLFETIGEEDIGEPKLADVIFKSVTDWNDAHRFEVLAIHSTEEFTRTVENALQSPDYEDVGLQSSEQDSSLLGLTWRWSVNESARLRNTLFYRSSDTQNIEGEAYPDLAGESPTPQSTPVRDQILYVREKEMEIGWRGDLDLVMPSGDILTAGALVSRPDLEFERRLTDDWTRYVYDATDSRENPTQRYILLTPADFDSRLSAAQTRIAAYADYTWHVGDYAITPGVRYDQDGFADDSMVSPRLMLNWRPDPMTHFWMAGGVYYQAPRYLDLAADALNIGLEHERSTQMVAGLSRHLADDLRFSAEAYHQRLDDLIVRDDRTTGLARNLGEGTGSGIDLSLSKRMSDTWSASATYSYSRARRDDNLGEGEYDADWDRPHAFGLVGAWQPNDRWSFAAKWRYASGRPTDSFISHADVLADSGGPLRYSKEIVGENTERMPAYHALSLRADYRRRFGPLSLIAFLDVINVYGRENGNTYEWDERRGVDTMDGLDEPLPIIGLKFEYSWTVDD